MKQIQLIILYFFLVQTLIAQKVVNEFTAIDAKALKLPDSLTTTTTGISDYITANFKTDKEKTRAIFIWIASNIEYDVDNMFAINFYESKEEKISKPLRTKKGICENYAALFNEICSKSNIKSFVIEGYTKQNGLASYIPHAWCAAAIDNSWFMFDPTWGSGYINKEKFYKKINNEYYKATPAALIKTHMPFDYLWQFLNFPVTNQEFYEGNTALNKSKPYFNFIDSIEVYEKQNYMERLSSSLLRIEKNGVKNALVFDRLRHIKLEIENDKQNKITNLYNLAVAEYNTGINDFNIFIQYRNHQFLPVKPDSDIQKMIDTVNTTLKDSKDKLSQIISPDTNTMAMISQLNKAIDDASTHAKEQQEWLTLYFGKGKSKRKSMFYEKKVTWFGIPVN